MASGAGDRGSAATGEAGQRTPRVSVLLFLLKFAVVFLVLQGGYTWLTASGAPPLPHRLQAHAASGLINLFMSGQPTSTDGEVIISKEVVIHIKKGCEGTDVVLLLTAALVAFPMGWRRRLLGIAWGTLLIYGLNLVRLVSLYGVARFRQTWFDFFHLSLWQSLFVLAAGAFFILWSTRETRGAE